MINEMSLNSIMHVINCVQLAGDYTVEMVSTHTCTAFLEGQDLQV